MRNLNMKLRLYFVATVLALCVPSAMAAAYRCAMMRNASIFLSPDSTSAKLGEIGRGREVIVLEVTPRFLHVEANITDEQTITGWIVNKGTVQASTPDGDKI